MDGFYGLAGRLIDYYRRQMQKQGNERYSVKAFCLDEQGQSICSFPTYKKITAGKTVKNEGFYYVLAAQLGIIFEPPSMLDHDFLADFEKHFGEVVTHHEISQIRYFCDYYLDLFQEMNQSLVISELWECLRLLQTVCLNEPYTIDCEKVTALIEVSQDNHFIVHLYYLLYLYTLFHDCQQAKAQALLVACHALTDQSLFKTVLEGLYLRELKQDREGAAKLVADLGSSRLPYLQLLACFVKDHFKYGPFSDSYTESLRRLMVMSQDNCPYFSPWDRQWIIMMNACSHYYHGRYQQAILDLSEIQDTLVTGFGYVFLILFNCYAMLDQPLPEMLYQQISEKTCCPVKDSSMVMAYLEMKTIKGCFEKCEQMIMQRFLPYFFQGHIHYFFTYFFYRELQSCTAHTGHSQLVDQYLKTAWQKGVYLD